MDDNLLLNLIRLVRNGRLLVRGCEVFNFGGLRMMDCGPYIEDYARLKNSADCDSSLQAFLSVYIRDVVVEVWHFEDFRTMMYTPSSQDYNRQCSPANGKSEAALSTLARVIFAYLRVHELYADIIQARATDVSVKVFTDPCEVPTLEPDMSSTKVWAIEGLVSIKVTYNRLWHRLLSPKLLPPLVSVLTYCDSSLNELPRTKQTAPIEMVNALDSRCGAVITVGSDSAGSGCSMPTPLFAPVPLPGSLGSGRFGHTYNAMRSPILGALDTFIMPPSVTTANNTSFIVPLSQGAAGAAILSGEVVTPAVPDHSFSAIPTFMDISGFSWSEECGNDSCCASDQLVELLEICDNVSLSEQPISITAVVENLGKPFL
uniref:WGS project CAEQ00000000 data, annotated contig 934 n=1 Tax=Trypanosoma congolense (strain IL3000) TaxID=1068625 RepID=F9WJP2_TRYCI|nr:unnamed protein product [Trypanosoma congolense IL3000]